MTPKLNTILPAQRLPGRSWLRRVGRSNAFTITISVILHGAVFLGFYRVAFRDERPTRRIIIPEARLAPIGGGPSQASTGNVPRLSPQPTPPARGGGVRSGGSPGLAGGSPLLLSEMPIVAVNLAGPSSVVVGDASGTQRASAGLAGAGAGGSLLGNGLGGSGGGGSGGLVGPATSFFGAAGNAYKVVYVVDVSNSLMATLDQVLTAELRSSIQNLTASQQFHIILSLPSEPLELSVKHLVYANAKNKREAADFISAMGKMRPVGVVDPSVALRRAFALRPELVYFLSDGDYDDRVRASLEAVVGDKNLLGDVAVTCIAFGFGDAAFLERLAKQTGGNFRRIDPR